METIRKEQNLSARPAFKEPEARPGSTPARGRLRRAASATGRGARRPGNPLRGAHGFALLDAIVGLALLGLLATGALTLAHGAVRLHVETRRTERAAEAAESVMRELDTVSWHRLPVVLGAPGSAARHQLDAGDSGAPARWQALRRGLGPGTLLVSVEGLGPGGAPARLDEALVLRVEVEALASGQRRPVRRRAWRF